MHAKVVHFPIAFLLVTPIFLLLALLSPDPSRGFAWSALILLLLGTLSAMIATRTGTMAAEVVRNDPNTPAQAKTVLRLHAKTARAATRIFILLSLLAIVVIGFRSRIPGLNQPTATRAATIVLLILNVAADVLLAYTANLGGRLVHEFGVSAAEKRPHEAIA